jgi:hypothetical protein
MTAATTLRPLAEVDNGQVSKKPVMIASSDGIKNEPDSTVIKWG